MSIYFYLFFSPFHPMWVRNPGPPPYTSSGPMPPSSIGAPPPLMSHSPGQPGGPPPGQGGQIFRPGYPSPPPLRIPSPSGGGNAAQAQAAALQGLQAFHQFRPPGGPGGLYRQQLLGMGGPPPGNFQVQASQAERFFSPYAPYGLLPPHPGQGGQVHPSQGHPPPGQPPHPQAMFGTPFDFRCVF